MTQFMRAHGHLAGPTHHHVVAGFCTGVLAAAITFPLLWYTGAIDALSEAAAAPRWTTVTAYALVMAIAGGVYGRIFRRAADDRRGGWLFGISYGYLLWLLGPVTAASLVMGRPLASDGAAQALILSHLAYGAALGLAFPWCHELIRKRMAPGM